MKSCAVFLIGFGNHIHTAAYPSLVYQTRCVDSDWLLLTIHEHIYLNDGYTDCFILEACHLKSSKFTNTCGITIRFGYKETHWGHRTVAGNIGTAGVQVSTVITVKIYSQFLQH